MSCKDIKIEFHLKDNHKTYWLQIIDALPKTWKDVILKDKRNASNLVIFGHHITRKSQISLTQMAYLVDTNDVKPTVQNDFDNFFETCNFNYKTRKAIGFKSLRLNCSDIAQVT